MMDNKTSSSLSTTTTNIPSSTILGAGASWDEIKHPTATSTSKKTLKEDVDLDLSCIIVQQQQQKILDRIFWGKLQGFNGAIEHSGDNETGEGSGDDEQITCELSKLPQNADAIFFFLSKYSDEADVLPENNLAVRVFDERSSSVFVSMKGLHSVLGTTNTNGSNNNNNSGRSFCFASCVKQNDGSWNVVELALPINVESALDPVIEKYIDTLIQSSLSGGLKYISNNNNNNNLADNRTAAAASSDAMRNRKSAAPMPENTGTHQSQNNQQTSTSSVLQRAQQHAPTQQQQNSTTSASSSSDNELPIIYYVFLVFVLFLVPIYFAM